MFYRDCEARKILLWTAAATLLLATRCTADTSAEFTAVGFYRATCSAASKCLSVPVVNLGHCCTLCAADPSCTIVNYFKSNRTCQLLSSTPSSIANATPDEQSYLMLKGNAVTVDVLPVAAAAQMQPVVGALIRSGSADGFTSYALPKAINVARCWSMCVTLTGSLCRLFAFHVSQLTCLVYDVDFYATWTTASINDSGWTSYYAKQSNGFKLLYKISKGIGVDASNAWLFGPNNSTASNSQMSMDATCACHLRSDIVDSWSRFPITMVSLVVAKLGSQTHYVNLSTNAGDSASTFFTSSKITASSWTDLNPSSLPWVMEIGRPPDSAGGRYFLMLKSHSLQCADDNGWLSVNGRTTPFCPYGGLPVPQFSYANGTTFTTFQANGAYADVLLIYGKL